MDRLGHSQDPGGGQDAPAAAITLHDVARVAEVSSTTVSHVINGTRFDAPDTTERVLRAIEQLRYQVNFNARNLKNGRSRVFGVLITDITNPYFSGVALIGFGDFEWAPLMRPRLTTVVQPEHAAGARAAELLIDRMERRSGEPPRRTLLPVELAVRESCGASGSSGAPDLQRLFGPLAAGLTGRRHERTRGGRRFGSPLGRSDRLTGRTGRKERSE